MTRLSAAARPAGPIHRFRHDRAGTGVGIVHLGIGAFHRAHMADYTQDLLDSRGGDWAILGASLRSAAVRDQLAPQDGLYTLVEQGPGGNRYRLIGALAGVIVAPERPAALIAAIAAPGTRIVSLTVTEKGYCHIPATGELDERHPDILHDLQAPDTPRSVIGFLAAGLAARRAAGLGGLTLLSCDNLPHNGAVLGRVLAHFADLARPGLGDWIAANVTTPSTMVDRIVPATTAADIAALEAATGVRDEGMVKAEPFRQWVVEDRFAAGRPAWEEAGVQMVSDVAPFEAAKLRLLNGSHSAIAWAGQLMGLAHVHEAVADPGIAAFVRRLMGDSAATLAPTPGQPHDRYAEALMERFANPALAHRTQQIAMDSSQKLPQRLLGTVRDRLAAGRPIRAHTLAVAAFIRHAMGRAEDGAALPISDPMAARFPAADGGNAADIVGRFLALSEIFGTDLPTDPGFRAAVTEALDRLLRDGLAATLRAATAEAA